jgi:hypothetical protein
MLTFLIIWLLSGYILWHVSYQLFQFIENERCSPITVGDLFLGLLMMWFGLLLLFPVILMGVCMLVQLYYDQLYDFFTQTAIKSPCDWFWKKEPEETEWGGAPNFEKMLRGVEQDWKKPSQNVVGSEQILVKVPEKDE